MFSSISGNGNRDRDVIEPVVPLERYLATCIKRQRLVITDKNIGLFHVDLLIEVLCRVPPKILIRCRCVCLGWYRLIYIHCIPRITPSLPLLGFDVRIWVSRPTRKLVVVRALIPSDRPEAEAEADDEDGIGNNIDAWPPVYHTDDPTAFRPGFLINYSPDAEDFIDSCNGLMLFMNKSTRMYMLWNPTTKQFVYRLHLPCKYGVDFVALAVEYKTRYFKIVAFPVAKSGATPFLHVFSRYTAKWRKHKVRYLVDNGAAIDLVRSSVYLDTRLYRLSGARFLLWYILKDDDDVICDCVKLPDADCLIGKTKNRIGCIGSFQERLQYGQSDTNLGLMKIWVFCVDKSEWILKHSIAFQALANHPQLPSSIPSKLKPLAFGPVSDAIIIWAPNHIFSYFCNSGKLVLLQIPNDVSNALKYPPYNAFPFAPRLLTLCQVDRSGTTYVPSEGHKA